MKIMTEWDTSRWRNWAKAAHAVYPPACFAEPDALLKDAASQAEADPVAKARVEFLRLGFDHAQLCAQVAGKLSLALEKATTSEIEAALVPLLQFRRKHEHTGISNFNHLAWIEELSWNLGEQTKQPPDLYP
jgi:hypothetical protein